MVFKKVYLFLVAMIVSLAAQAQGLLPDFSTEDAPVWYQVQFKTGGACLTDMGSGQKLKTAAKSANDGQKWQFIGTKENFKMKSKKGNFVSFASDRFTTSKTSGIELKLVGSTNANASECFEIQKKTSNRSMNQFGGAGTGKELGEWTAGDPNNPLSFVPMFVKLPEFSTDEKTVWYFIQFRNGMKAFADKGVDECVRTDNPEPVEEQLWKLVGDENNFQLVNQLGNYVVVSKKSEPNTGAAANGTPVRTSKEAYGPGFSLRESGSSDYSPAWEIQPNDTKGKCFNQWGGAGTGRTIGVWSANDNNNPVAFVDPDVMVYSDYKSTGIEGYVPEHDLTMWYTQPATTAPLFTPDNWYSNWMEYALPLGDGQFGASLFGGIEKDQILFNEKTLWSGRSTDNGSYGKYEVFGSVFAKNLGGDFHYTTKRAAKNYYRQLDLTTATGKVSFANQEGLTYNREYIASHPARVIAAHYTAAEKGKINLLFTLESGKPGVKAETSYADGEATFSGKLQTVSYNARLKVINVGGTLKTTAEGIEVRDADEVLVLLAGGTDFDAYSKTYVSNTAKLAGDIQARINDAAKKTWSELYQEHVADFQKYFGRVDFHLAGTKNEIPTNELIDTYAGGKGPNALMLEQLYFAYGRYLEISSSRGVDLPSNLQGIWNNNAQPAWNADIHANINVQMNYWPAETTNLSEMHVPFLNYIWNMAENHEQWKKYAKDAGQSEGWTCYTENNIFGGVGGFAHNYVIANAWYCTHLWQHYRYTLDKEYLKKVFPAMWSASRFWIGRLKKAEDGKYECPNEYSPEHGPSQNAVAHAQQLVFDLLDNTLKAAEILGDEVKIDAKQLETHKDRLANLDRGLATETYDGKWGTNDVKRGAKLLREWKYSPYSVGQNGHRHMSHLMCLYPFSQIHPGTELFEAAVNSMKLRGDGATGWSMGWKINLWARALDGDHARTILNNALKHAVSSSGVYYNLFDAHNPFQIDGNFGACAGIAEMAMQSNSDTIRILPALPSAWKTGHMNGLKAVGDFTVDVAWENLKPTEVKIVSHQGQPLMINYKDLATRKIMVNGVEVAAEMINANTVKVPAAAGDVVTIDFSAVATGVKLVPTAVEKVQVSVDGRNVTVDGARKVVVNDLAGRAIQTTSKKTFSVAQAAGHAVVLQVTDHAGQVSSHKVVLK